MKKKVVVAIMAASMIMAGCGSLAGRHNIDSGFAYIENHDYNRAFESFEAAEDKEEEQ